ncbi:MAG: type IX secretion system membrane protein PorP/SprF [Flavobacteriales bacterium]|nr:type IX secretion system membrane protein PorP/SprF [Flavobacteriales bacterium]
MRTARRHIALFATLAMMWSVSAQDPQFSQFYAAPQYLNPALTGNTQQDRIALNYRLQWPGIQPGFETYAFAYDHRFADANSGLGGYVLRDKAGTLGLHFTTIAMAYSYEARLDHKRAFRFGLRMGYTMRGIDPSGYLFADQIIRDGAPRTIETGLVEQISYLDLAAGGLYFSERYWVGISLTHLNRPNQSLFLERDARLPMRVSLHGGYLFALDGMRFDRSKTRMTLATHYKAQGKWDQLDLGGYIERHRMIGGLWYRGLPILKSYAPGYPNSEAVILLVGFETEQQLRITYSYDITISRLTMASGGAHEISLSYEWPRHTKNRRVRIVPCPKF